MEFRTHKLWRRWLRSSSMIHTCCTVEPQLLLISHAVLWKPQQTQITLRTKDSHRRLCMRAPPAGASVSASLICALGRHRWPAQLVSLRLNQPCDTGGEWADTVHRMTCIFFFVFLSMLGEKEFILVVLVHLQRNTPTNPPECNAGWHVQRHRATSFPSCYLRMTPRGQRRCSIGL